jgi:hypothetical protein
VDGKRFDLSKVDRVAYHAASSPNLVRYGIRLGQGATKCYFLYDAYKRGTEMEDAATNWRSIVGLLQQTACPRLAIEASLAIKGGQQIRIGNDILASAEGLRRRRLFAKTVPWSLITSADFHRGNVRVWTVGSVGSNRPEMITAMGGWNAVIMPRLIQLMASTA